MRLLYLLIFMLGAVAVQAACLLRVVVPEEDKGDVVVMIDGAVVDDWDGEPVALTEGNHHISVKKPGRKNFSKQFSIKEGDDIRMPVKLVPNALEVRLDVNPDTEVWLNGMQVSTGPWSGLMKEGMNHVMLTKPHYNKKTYSLMIEPGERPMSLHLDDPTPIVYTYEFKTDPAGANLFVDGVCRGVTPISVSDMTVGLHEITLRKNNYKTLTFSIDVGNPDGPDKLNLRLERQ